MVCRVPIILLSPISETYSDMRNRKHLLLITAFLTLILSACTKEADREFPRIRTVGIGTITETGVMLKGEITNYKSIDLEDHGFIISEGTTINDQMFALSLGDGLGTSRFTGLLSSRMKEGQTYCFAAYGIAGGIMSVGNEMTFVSQGSEPPALLNFTPNTGQVGDTVSITCSGILGLQNDYSVSFNTIRAEIVGFSDNVIRVIVPLSLNSTESIISVSGYGATASFESPYTLSTPVISSFSPAEVYPGDEVIITGMNFHKEKSLNIVLFNNTPATVSTATNTELVIISRFPPDSMNYITVSVSGQSCTSATEIKVKRPLTDYFEPTSGTYGDEVHIFGNGLLAVPVEDILMNGITSEIISIANNEIIFRVPGSLTDCESEIQIIYSGYTTTLDYTFLLDPPSITGFSQNEPAIGNDLTIYGNNFSPIAQNNRVKIGERELIPYSSSKDQIVVTLDAGLESGSYKVGVKTCGEFVYSDSEINLTEPVWLRIADFPGGEAYKMAGFAIGDFGYAGLGTRMNHDYIRQVWKYDPKLNVWSPTSVFPGPTRILAHGFSINGVGYLGGGFDIDASYRNTLRDYYSYNSGSDLWSVDSYYDGPVNDAFRGGGEVIGSEFISAMTKADIYKLSINPSIWSRLGTVAGKVYPHCSTFAIGNIIYFIGGIDIDVDPQIIRNEVWAYKTQDGQWERKGDFPGAARYTATGFSLNGVGYFGLGYDKNSYFRDFWRYLPETDTWEKIENFPGNARASAVLFIINNKAYIGTGIVGTGVFSKDMYRFKGIE